MGTHLNFDLIINSGIDVQLDNREIRGSMGGGGRWSLPPVCLLPGTLLLFSLRCSKVYLRTWSYILSSSTNDLALNTTIHSLLYHVSCLIG